MGSGPHDFLRRLARGEYGNYKNFFNDVLEPLFYDTLATERGEEAWCKRFKCRIPFLNGGLFEPLSEYDWDGIDLSLPNELFFNGEINAEGDTGTGILDVFDRYNFTVNEAEPLEQEVAIDPEMLGKVFENLIEENLRKGMGTYYTPREVVHYMCQESLVSYLYRAINTVDIPIATSTPIQDPLFGQKHAEQGVLSAATIKEKITRDDLSALIHSGEQAAHYEAARKAGTVRYRPQLPKSIEGNAAVIDEKLHDITVCDPAIGSGAFPVGMMTEIVRARLALTPYFKDADERSSYHFKRQAIQSCLYGVDIDRGAVEIAKLRLWLSLVVDEEDLTHLKPLPNLDFKIVAGNSLLGFPFQSHGLGEIEQLKADYFDEPDHGRKADLKAQIDRRIQSHLALSVKTLGYQVDFDYRLFFSEVFRSRGGFDVVIANPPYLSAIEFKKHYPPEDRAALNQLFETAHGTYDLYILFIEKGIVLLREGGNLAFINPNKYLSAQYAVALREFLLRKVRLDRLVNVSGIRVFESASVYPVVSFMTNDRSAQSYQVELVLPTRSDLEWFDQSEFAIYRIDSSLLNALPEHIWGFLLSTNIDLLLRLMKDSRPLSEFAEINASTTASEADAYGRYLTEKAGKNSLKVINTGTIDRYASLWGIAQLTHGGRRFKEPYLPLAAAEVNRRRQDMYKSSKLIFAKMAKGCEAFFDQGGEFASLNTNCLYSPKDGASLTFLAGFCNSKMFMFFYSQFFGALRMSGGYFQFQAPQLRVIPFKAPSKETETKVSKLVERIVAAKAKDSQADTTPWEKGIDELLYRLYGVAEDEIEVVERAV